MANEPGSFCWFECGTRDLERTKAFYSRVLGWNPVDSPMPGEHGGVYTLLKVGDEDVAGMYELSGPQFEGVPSHWLSYVCVEDADAASRKAEALGGVVLMAPFDVPGVGRMAFFSDPTGAHIAIFQPGEHHGVGDAAVLGWVELHTRDTERARTFYTGLFGWRVKDDPDGQYTEFLLGERPIAGMMAIPPEQQQRMPDNWLPYALVEDCDSVVELADGLGATVVMHAQDVPNVGRFAVLADPGGAHLAVIKLDAKV
jgi:predicted enzyme related to lactoylglutathione lyase